MTQAYSIFSLGDQAVSFEFSGSEIDLTTLETLASMKHWIELNSFPGLRDVVLGYRSLSVMYNLLEVISSGIPGSAQGFVKKKLSEAHVFASRNRIQATTRHIRVPVCYSRKFGFDIDAVCTRHQISHDDLVRLHTAIAYQVYLIGFLPGFPYLGFVDPKLETPRHPTPRAMVPAGSVGIAGAQTGIYPFDSPGGWQIIGRTPMSLFNPSSVPPVPIEAGDAVTFYPIDESEFDHYQRSAT